MDTKSFCLFLKNISDAEKRQLASLYSTGEKAVISPKLYEYRRFFAKYGILLSEEWALAYLLWRKNN